MGDKASYPWKNLLDVFTVKTDVINIKTVILLGGYKNTTAANGTFVFVKKTVVNEINTNNFIKILKNG